MWTAYAMDTFFGPYLSEFTDCPAPNVPEMPAYLISFALNRAFVPTPDEKRRASLVLLAGFIRRASMAIIEYGAGVEAAREYTAALSEQTLIGRHTMAVARFENCIMQLCAAQSCMAALEHLYPQFGKLFTEGDGSEHDRLNKLANRLRHFHNDIVEAATKPTTPPFSIAPIWLTNTGIMSRRNTKTYGLTYMELADFLVDATNTAKMIAEGPIP